MPEKDYEITRTLNVTPEGYELTMCITQSRWKGDKHIAETLTVKTLRPHANAITSKEIEEVVANYEMA